MKLKAENDNVRRLSVVPGVCSILDVPCNEYLNSVFNIANNILPSLEDTDECVYKKMRVMSSFHR